MRVPKTSLAAFLLVVSVAARAPADSCVKPDVVDVVPPDGANDVPTNAKLFAMYPAYADYLGEDVTLEHVGFGEELLTPEYSANEGLLSVTPPAELTPGDEYVIRWPALRGKNTSSLGRGKNVSFRVGVGPDVEPPFFEGLTGIDWDVERERDECSDTLEERYVFHLEVGESSDDGGGAALRVNLFQTVGKNVSAPEPIYMRRLPDRGESVRVSLTTGESTGRVCFSASAIDSAEFQSGSTAEQCVKTVPPPFFEGCRAAPPPKAGASFGLMLGLASGLLLRRAIRRNPPAA
jgi:hypothetical protein